MTGRNLARIKYYNFFFFFTHFLKTRLTSSNNTVAETGSAHWLQFNPTASVQVVEWTHAARCGSRLFSSVETNQK